MQQLYGSIPISSGARAADKRVPCQIAVAATATKQAAVMIEMNC